MNRTRYNSALVESIEDNPMPKNIWEKRSRGTVNGVPFDYLRSEEEIKNYKLNYIQTKVFFNHTRNTFFESISENL